MDNLPKHKYSVGDIVKYDLSGGGINTGYGVITGFEDKASGSYIVLIVTNDFAAEGHLWSLYEFELSPA